MSGGGVAYRFGGRILYVHEGACEVLLAEAFSHEMSGVTLRKVGPIPVSDAERCEVVGCVKFAAQMAHAVRRLADVLERVDTGEVFGNFTCDEVDALADVLRIAGREQAADFVIGEHARSDEDPNDRHYSGERCRCGALVSDHVRGCGSVTL